MRSVSCGLGPFPVVCCGAMVVVLFLAGCGGRQPRIVAEQSPIDDKLTCIHLQGEHAGNLSRIDDLHKERATAGRDNVGAFLALGVLALDLNDTEQKETDALHLRNKRLALLAERAGCPSIAGP